MKTSDFILALILALPRNNVVVDGHIFYKQQRRGRSSKFSHTYSGFHS